MFDFGDELTIESYRIPWLIWIQLAVLCLLLFLLFCFTSDLSDNNIATANNYANSSLSSGSTSTLGRPILEHRSSKTITNRLQSSQGGENLISIKGEIETSTAEGGIVAEDETETESSLSNDADYLDHHPCDYFRFAKLAFLKCFGLDFLSQNSSRKDR